MLRGSLWVFTRLCLLSVAFGLFIMFFRYVVVPSLRAYRHDSESQLNNLSEDSVYELISVKDLERKEGDFRLFLVTVKDHNGNTKECVGLIKVNETYYGLYKALENLLPH